MNNVDPAKLATTIAAIRKNNQYADIEDSLVERIAADELTKRRNPKDVVKHARSRLRQAGTAYFKRKINFDRALTELAAADTPEAQRDVCTKLMQLHASTAERLPILPELFELLAAELPTPNSVLDIASGLNPLTIPWQQLAPNASYHAVDIFGDMMNFLAQALPMLGVNGKATCASVLPNPPTDTVDVAYVFKAISCLEQLDPQAGETLLHGLNAKHIVATFPLQSLGGRKKGMQSTYTARMETLTANQPWNVRSFVFETELVYIIDKTGGA